MYIYHISSTNRRQIVIRRRSGRAKDFISSGCPLIRRKIREPKKENLFIGAGKSLFIIIVRDYYYYYYR